MRIDSHSSKILNLKKLIEAYFESTLMNALLLNSIPAHTIKATSAALPQRF